MLHKLTLNPKCPLVKKDMDNIHSMHITVCNIFDKGVLWRFKKGVLFARGKSLRYLPPGYVLSLESIDETWDREADFELTANPTRLVRDNGQKNGRRVPSEPLEWLHRKAAVSGFEIIRAHVDEKRIVRGSKAGHSLTFFAVDFSGRIRIADKDLFKSTLTAGIGAAKGYGFGLLINQGKEDNHGK